MPNVDVVVIGAGPTGLFLASELALRGLRVSVLERLSEPDPTIKAGSINVASAEILDRRGLLSALEQVQRRLAESVAAFGGRPAQLMRAARTDAFPAVGHFAGMLFRPELLDQGDPLLRAHHAAVQGVLVPQRDLEELLGEHCAGLGVEVRRGVDVRGVRSTAAEVTVDTDTGPATAAWVVAADGGRSVVRKQLGIEFEGTEATLVGYQAIADFDDVEGLPRGWTWTPRGIYTYGPIPGRILVARFAAPPADRDAPVTLAELQDAVRDVTGLPVTLTALHGRATRWSDNARQARHYRSGRVLLAGDAAHVHSPFSGQGLNLGLGDANNLGWKLAAVVKGDAAPDLLDTYESERHPIAAAVLDWTRAQVALMRGDEHTRQLRRVVEDELFTMPGVLNRVVAQTAGLRQRYDVGDGGSPLAGSIVGDELLADGSRLADHAHDGRFVLVDRTPDGRHAATVPAIAYVADPGGRGPSLLARPDGVIVWAAGADDDAGADDAGADHDADASRRLAAATARWIRAH